MEYTRLDDFLLDLPRLAGGVKEKLSAADGLFCLQTDSRTLWLRLRSGEVELMSDCDEKPDCTVKAEERLLLDLLCGRTNPLKVLLTGKVRVSGDKGKLLKLAALAV